MDLAIDRRDVTGGGSMILMAAGCSWAAEPWPAKPVRWIVPYPADACLAADFGRLMDAEGAKWAAAVKASGASLE